jgi:nucleoside-diphosphate-sugar epimerase
VKPCYALPRVLRDRAQTLGYIHLGMPSLSPPATVAVTGANGFIGSHIVARLLEDGFNVRAVVRDASDGAKVAHLLALPVGDPAALVLKSCGDMTKAGAYDEAFAGCDAIVHTAAVVEILDNRNAMNAIVRPAVTGTKNVLASARKAGSVKRVVVTSSVAAIQLPYGKPDDHVYTEEDWNDWSTIETDPYGQQCVLRSPPHLPLPWL